MTEDSAITQQARVLPKDLRRPSLGQGVLRFLGSLAKRSEAELYLRIYQDLPPGRFALFVPTLDVLEHRGGTLAEQLGFLHELGLSPTLLVGAVDKIRWNVVQDFVSALNDVGLRANVQALEGLSRLAREVVQQPLADGEIRLLSTQEPSDEVIAQVAKELAPRKTIFLRREGGIGPHRIAQVEISPAHFLQTADSGIGVINLRSDAPSLFQSEILTADDQLYLRRAQLVLETSSSKNQQTTVSVATSLSLLVELFTVSGAGTLIKQGAEIECVDNYAGLDQTKLGQLIETSFGRPLLADFWQRAALRIFFESEYRGVALLEPGKHAAFLSKFAVLPVARGEGLGQDLWWQVSKLYPSLYFRARPNNPINTWYCAVSDGMHRGDNWCTYWKGISHQMIPEVIEDAQARPVDLPLCREASFNHPAQANQEP